jgi:hypothetical protein
MRIGRRAAYTFIASAFAASACGGKAALDDRVGDPSTTCVGHVGTLVLETRDDVVSAANVGVVDGDLVIVADEPYEITAEDLPCLTAVRGAVTIGSEKPSAFTSIVLGAVETIDRGLVIGYVNIQVPGGMALAFPRLRRVGTPANAGSVTIAEANVSDEVRISALEEVHGNLMIGWLTARAVDLGALRTVSESLSLGPAAELEQLDFGQLELVGGDVTADLMPHIAYSSVLTIGGLTEGTTRSTQVGCARADGDMSPDCANL